jgi:hypothetical protein
MGWVDNRYKQHKLNISNITNIIRPRKERGGYRHEGYGTASPLAMIRPQLGAGLYP